ncbi:MAG: hypothetical protein PHT40_02080 [Patescibacteria group bacterium]|nr:hypothetical protein [Patescibacteria group bacterium]
MKLNFTYNLDKDIENFIIAKTAVGAREHLSRRQAEYEKIYGPNLDKEKIKKFILDFTAERKINMADRIETLQKEWASINDEFFQKIEKIFGVKLPVEEITAYLTVNDRCGYNPNQYYFFVSALTLAPKLICAHEIFHFFIHFCFEKWLKDEIGLNPKEFYDLKESLNEILNHEFSDLVEGKDKPNMEYQTAMRQKIGELWQKEKNIKKVIEEMVKK